MTAVGSSPSIRTSTPADRSARSGATIGLDGDVLNWRQRYTRLLTVTDVVVVVWAAAGAHFVRSSLRPTSDADPYAVPHLTTTGAVIALWLLVLAIFDTRTSKVIGFGSEEYKRVLQATFVVFALVAMTSYLFGLDLPRSYLLIVMPAGSGRPAGQSLDLATLAARPA